MYQFGGNRSINAIDASGLTHEDRWIPEPSLAAYGGGPTLGDLFTDTRFPNCHSERWEFRLDSPSGRDNWLISLLKQKLSERLRVRLLFQKRECSFCCPAGTLHAGQCRFSSSESWSLAVELRHIPPGVGDWAYGWTASAGVSGSVGILWDGCSDTRSGYGCIEGRGCVGGMLRGKGPGLVVEGIVEGCVIVKLCAASDGRVTIQVCSSARAVGRGELLEFFRYSHTFERYWCSSPRQLAAIGGT